MAEQKDPPRPHGDPLDDAQLHAGERAAGRNVESGKRDRQTRDVGHGSEENAAQRQSDATSDVVGFGGTEEPTAGTTSDANGTPAGDDADGQRRRRQYDNGAELVSKLD